MTLVTFDPDRILRALSEHGVEFIVIGGVAAALSGSPLVTFDVDITPRRTHENLERLSAALTALDARVREENTPGGLAFTHDASSLADAAMWNLTTSAGDLDIAFLPAGTQGFDDLARDALSMEVAGRHVLVACLADVVRSKDAAGREKDRAALPILRRLLDPDSL